MARRVKWTVDAEEPPRRLDVALADQTDWLSRSVASNVIRNGLVRVNGDIETRVSTSLKAGDEVDSFLPDAVAENNRPEPADIPVSIVYQDRSLVVVDKPAGIAVHPGPGHRDDTLVNGLLRLFPEISNVGAPDRPGVVHRLDLDTSGLLIFALTPEAYAELGKAMRAHTIKRTYTSLVNGQVIPTEGTIDAPIGRDPSNRTRQAVVDTGRTARTHYKTIEQLSQATLLELELETGRMHQIRVHMAAIGFPVLGDRSYGRGHFVSGLDRQFLHASRLRFKHSEAGEEIEVESPLPPDLAGVLEELRHN